MSELNECPEGYREINQDGTCWGKSEGNNLISKDCWDCEYFSPTECPRGYRMVIRDEKCWGLDEEGKLKQECSAHCVYCSRWDHIPVLIGKRKADL